MTCCSEIATTLSIMTFSVRTLSITTLSTTGLVFTFSINENQHSNTLPLCWMSSCLVPHFIYCYAVCHYTDCHYAEYHYAECHYAECHYAECHYAEGHYAECHGVIVILLFWWVSIIKHFNCCKKSLKGDVNNGNTTLSIMTFSFAIEKCNTQYNDT